MVYEQSSLRDLEKDEESKGSSAPNNHNQLHRIEDE